MDKLIRFALLPRGGEPVIWDFGSAARHHQLFDGWLDYPARRRDGDTTLGELPTTSGARAGISTLRGAFHPQAGVAEEVARKIAAELAEYGLTGAPVGVDVVELPVLEALQAAGLTVVDGQQVFLEARRIKTPDEISLLTQACSMVDAAYEELYRFLRPGVRENECVGLVSKVLYDLGSEYVEGRQRHLRRALLAAPARLQRPHRAARRPGVLRHPAQPPRLPDLLLPLLRGRQRVAGHAGRVRALPRVHGRRDRPGAPGATTADVVSVWPTAQEFGFPDEEGRVRAAVRPRRRAGDLGEADLQPAGLPRPPETLAEGMVFALETYWPAADGWSAARIEEEVVVTADGCEVITKFPAEELLVAGPRTSRRAAAARLRESVTPEHREQAAAMRRRWDGPTEGMTRQAGEVHERPTLIRAVTCSRWIRPSATCRRATC
jgi:hypothetical protein